MALVLSINHMNTKHKNDSFLSINVWNSHLDAKSTLLILHTVGGDGVVRGGNGSADHIANSVDASSHSWKLNNRNCVFSLQRQFVFIARLVAASAAISARSLFFLLLSRRYSLGSGQREKEKSGENAHSCTLQNMPRS